MNFKNKRQQYITQLLQKTTQKAQTITWIYNSLYYEYSEDVSRKTVERDMLELERENIIISSNEYPRTYGISSTRKILLELTQSEILRLITILQNIPQTEFRDMLILKLGKLIS